MTGSSRNRVLVPFDFRCWQLQGRRQVKQSGVDSKGRVWAGVSPPDSG